MPSPKLPKGLWKTTAVIWTEYDPQETPLGELAREATCGEGYCDSQEAEFVTDPAQFPDTEFFVVEGTDDDDEG